MFDLYRWLFLLSFTSSLSLPAFTLCVHQTLFTGRIGWRDRRCTWIFHRISILSDPRDTRRQESKCWAGENFPPETGFPFRGSYTVQWVAHEIWVQVVRRSKNWQIVLSSWMDGDADPEEKASEERSGAEKRNAVIGIHTTELLPNFRQRCTQQLLLLPLESGSTVSADCSWYQTDTYKAGAINTVSGETFSLNR